MKKLKLTYLRFEFWFGAYFGWIFKNQMRKPHKQCRRQQGVCIGNGCLGTCIREFVNEV